MHVTMKDLLDRAEEQLVARNEVCERQALRIDQLQLLLIKEHRKRQSLEDECKRRREACAELRDKQSELLRANRRLEAMLGELRHEVGEERWHEIEMKIDLRDKDGNIIRPPSMEDIPF